MARGGEDETEAPEDARDEWMLSTAGCGIVLLYGCFAFREKSKKRLMKGLLCTLLEALLNPEFLEDSGVAMMDLGSLCQCRAYRQGAESCPHLRGAVKQLRREGTAPQRKVALALEEAITMVDVCPPSCHWLRRAILAVRNVVDAAAPSMAFTQDATKAESTRAPGKKRRRVDQDLKHAVINDMIVSGRAKSSHAAARSLGDVVAKSTDKWDDRASLLYQAACWASCQGLRALSVAVDAKRLGQPAEETEVFAAWAWPQDVAMWLPPMVGCGLRPLGPQACMARRTIRRSL